MDHTTRREWLGGLAAASLGGLAAACRPRGALLSPREARLLRAGPRPLPVVIFDPEHPDPGSVLRQRAREASALPASTLAELDARMRETLAASGGVGLAAPQVGLGRRIILVQLQREGKPVLTCVDPRIARRASAQLAGYEGCLSIPGVGGEVERAAWVQVDYLDLRGKAHTHRAEGWEARIFQHEVDHLNGRLYIDRLKGPLLPMDEIRSRRREGESLGPPAGGRSTVTARMGSHDNSSCIRPGVSVRRACSCASPDHRDRRSRPWVM